MKIILIAAMTKDRVIGRNGDLPWHMPEDLKFFKRTTTGHAVVMGRKTYESINRPLPNRRNIVITRQSQELNSMAGSWSEDGKTSLDIANSLEAALALCEQRGEASVFIVGGGQIYAEALPVADEMLLTHVPGEGITGDTYFPAWSPSEWQAVGPADPAFPAATRYVRASAGNHSSK